MFKCHFNPIGTTFKNTDIEKVYELPYFTSIAYTHFGKNENMFMYSMVKEVLIPNWVKEIPRGFLVGCYELDHVILPPKIEYLTEQVINVNNPHNRFRYLISLAAVPPPANENMFGYRDANQKIRTIFVPDESVSLYKSADVWNWEGWNIYPISEFQSVYPHETAKDLQYYHII